MTGRPPSCLCGDCQKCRNRVRARAVYQALTIEERREIIARRDRERVRAADAARFQRHKASRMAQARAWAQAHPDAARERRRQWIERNPEKATAHRLVRNAIQRGDLVRQPCERCGSPRSHAHHDDYAEPLNVRWLCSEHHAEAHRALRQNRLQEYQA